ncbi:MAG: hypothetical protein Q8P41_02265, partial [Pseudomonadota bacterium]|nr:hypothetical protein [Pseudomonadota bacterium]
MTSDAGTTAPAAPEAAPPGASPGGGVRALVTAFATAGACVALSYLHPALADYRPWEPGDPIPVLAALVPDREGRVVEDAISGLALAPAEDDELAVGEPGGAEASPGVAAEDAPPGPASAPLAGVAALPPRSS